MSSAAIVDSGESSAIILFNALSIVLYSSLVLADTISACTSCTCVVLKLLN